MDGMDRCPDNKLTIIMIWNIGIRVLGFGNMS